MRSPFSLGIGQRLDAGVGQYIYMHRWSKQVPRVSWFCTSAELHVFFSASINSERTKKSYRVDDFRERLINSHSGLERQGVMQCTCALPCISMSRQGRIYLWWVGARERERERQNETLDVDWDNKIKLNWIREIWGESSRAIVYICVRVYVGARVGWAFSCIYLCVEESK